MRRIVALAAALCLLAALPVPVHSQSGQQVLQGTQLKLILLNGLSTSVAREGDPFVATVAEPVYFGGQLVLPAGARVNGEVGQIQKARRFGLLRSQAMMSLKFKSIEIDRREFPAPMSIISIHQTMSQGEGTGKRRGDLRTEEGVIVESKRDVKGALTTVALGGAGGTGVGAIFSHVVRGLTIGLIGGTSYVMIRKGKEVELPAQTGLLVRLDSTVTIPNLTQGGTPYTSGQP